jgi:hypothetical protein
MADESGTEHHDAARAAEASAQVKRRFFVAATASTLLLRWPVLVRARNLAKNSSTETKAQPPCPRNFMQPCGSATVWLNVASGRYYYKGDRWYGHTERGAYICEREAINGGNRASLG